MGQRNARPVESHEVPLEKALSPEEFCARHLETGDLVFVSGNSLSSTLTKWGTWSRWSHVMMVDACDSNPHPERIFAWESTKDEDDCTDVRTGSNHKKGVRLVHMATRLRAYATMDGLMQMPVGLVKLRLPRGVSRLELYRLLDAFEDLQHPKNYEQFKINLARVAFPAVLGENLAEERDYFCSKLAVATYKYMHVVDRRCSTAAMTAPAHLSDRTDGIPLINGFTLGPEIHVYTIQVTPPTSEPVSSSSHIPRIMAGEVEIILSPIGDTPGASRIRRVNNHLEV